MSAWHSQQHQQPVFVIFDQVKPDPEQDLRHCPITRCWIVVDHRLQFQNIMKIRCVHPGLWGAWSLLCTVASNNHNRLFMTDNCRPVHHSITAICITRCWLLGSINIQPLLKITVVTQSSAARRTGSPRYRGLRHNSNVRYIETQSVTDIGYNLYLVTTEPVSVGRRGQGRPVWAPHQSHKLPPHAAWSVAWPPTNPA